MESIIRGVAMISLGMIGGYVLAPWAQAAEKESMKVTSRKKLMKTGIKGGWVNIKKGMKAGDTAQMLKGAGILADAASKIPSSFAHKDLSGNTRAKMVIWDKKPEFDKIAMTLASSAKSFAAAVKTGQKEKIGAAMKMVGANFGQCHKMFRAKKKKSNFSLFRAQYIHRSGRHGLDMYTN